MPDLPDDRQCTHIFSEGEKADTRCTAYRVTNSRFCTFHGENRIANIERNSLKIARRKELQEKLEFEHMPLRTVEDVQAGLENIVNGVLGGFLKRDKAAPLAIFMTLAYKIAKENKMRAQPTSSLKLSVTNEGTKVNVRFATHEQMDQFLKGNDAVGVAILKQLEAEGRAKNVRGKGPDVIEVEAREVVDLEEIKVPVKDIVKISEKTDIPLTKKQVIDLFGTCLKDTEGEEYVKHPIDLTGFGHAFKEEGLPIEAQPRHHKWERVLKPVPDNPTYQVQWWHCAYCETERPNQDKDVCEKAPPPEY